MNDNTFRTLMKLAFKLRKEGSSYNQIMQSLGIAKSTLSSWFKNKEFSVKIKKSLIKKAQIRARKQLKLLAAFHKAKWQIIHDSYRKEAKTLFPKLMNDRLFGAGLTIYWGEGDKNPKNGIVRVSNTDHRMLRIFTLFLLKTCKIKLKKIKIWLLLYPDLKVNKCKNFWSDKLNLSYEHFVKPTFIIGREKKKRVNYGICSVQVYSRELKEKILEWIDLYSVKLEKAGMV